MMNEKNALTASSQQTRDEDALYREAVRQVYRTLRKSSRHDTGVISIELEFCEMAWANAIRGAFDPQRDLRVKVRYLHAAPYFQNDATVLLWEHIDFASWWERLRRPGEPDGSEAVDAALQRQSLPMHLRAAESALSETVAEYGKAHRLDGVTSFLKDRGYSDEEAAQAVCSLRAAPLRGLVHNNWPDQFGAFLRGEDLRSLRLRAVLAGWIGATVVLLAWLHPLDPSTQRWALGIATVTSVGIGGYGLLSRPASEYLDRPSERRSTPVSLVAGLIWLLSLPLLVPAGIYMLFSEAVFRFGTSLLRDIEAQPETHPIGQALGWIVLAATPWAGFVVGWVLFTPEGG